MKYQQPEDKTLTSCKECVLAVYDGDTQVSCLANRIEKLDHIEAYDEDKNFYVVKRFCNYYRASNESYLCDGKPDLEKIKYESLITYDVVILCNDVNEDYYNYIIKLFDSIKSKYDVSKVEIHLLYTIANKKQIQIIKELSNVMGNCSVTFYRDKLFLHNLLTKSKRSYHLLIDRYNVPDVNILNRINSLVNDDMKKLITINNNGAYAVSNLAYKITSFQNKSYQYDEIVNSIVNESKEKNLHESL